jgi:hypothetical protein
LPTNRKKINHYRRILGQTNINKEALVPGQIVSFNYMGKNIWDRNPLIIFLFRDRDKNDLVHGININYLYENDVQSVFRMMTKRVNAKIAYEKSSEGYAYLQLEENKNIRTGVHAQDLYEEVIKPIMFKSPRTKDCYRTYAYTKMTSIKLVNYKLDVIEEAIRKNTKLSKSALKTAELYKNMQEQKIEAETDNVRVEQQDKIRKEIQS